jgi:integrase
MLSVRTVGAAKPRDRAYKLSDGDGLYLFVSPAGGKSWRANFAAGGKQQTRTYGRFPAVGLADARKAHQQARETTEPAGRASAPPFSDVAKLWLHKHLPSLSNPKHRGQVESTLERFAYPALGTRPVDLIERKELTAVVLAAQAGDKVETAHRVAGRITAVFDYAQDLGLIDKHPAAHLSRVLTARKVKKPMPCIPSLEAGDLLRAINTYPEPVTRYALLLMAHTFPRVNELLGFDKGEIREDGAVWIIPGERMKLDLPHVVPLSRQAQALIAQLSAMSGSALVIESPARPGHKLSENTLLFALYRLGYRGRMTAHGFRALASTVLNEQSGFSRDVIERQLAHKESDDVRAAYNRAEYLDQRRKLMQWWSDWLQQTAEGQKHASA